MARIDYPAGAQETGRVHFGQMMLYSPVVGQLVTDQGSRQITDGALDPRLREMAILNSGLRFDAPYEWDQHEPIARSVGVTGTQIDAIRAHDWQSPAFTPAQRDVLRLADAVALEPRPADDVFRAAAGLLSPQELVELVVLVGYYFEVARVTTAFDLEPDSPGGDALLRKVTRDMRAQDRKGEATP